MHGHMHLLDIRVFTLAIIVIMATMILIEEGRKYVDLNARTIGDSAKRRFREHFG